MTTIDYSKYKLENTPTSGGIDYRKYSLNAPQQASQEAPATLLSKAAGVTDAIFGGGGVGELIGTQAAKGTFGKGVQKLLTGREMTPEMEANVDNGPSLGRVAGSALRSAALFTPVGKIASVAGPVIGRTAGQALAGGIAGYASDVGRNLDEGKTGLKASTPGLGATLGALIPVGAAVVRGAGSIFKTTGEKIITMNVKPSKVDIEDGFNVANLRKYKIDGTLQQMLDKTQSLLAERSSKIGATMQGSDEVLNLHGLVNKTAEQLSSDGIKGFGSNKSLFTALDNLSDEIRLIAPQGTVNLTDAQKIKQAAGYFGAWKWNLPDPDSKASERVYNAFYNVLKKELEDKGGPVVGKLNREMSEIIPIANALIRRIPVAARNQALSLGDMVTLTGAVFNPSAALLTLINVAQRSTQAGGMIRNTGTFMQKSGVNPSRVRQALGRGVLNAINAPQNPDTQGIRRLPQQ